MYTEINVTETKESQARLAQSVERQALNLMVVGSSPTVGVFSFFRVFSLLFFCLSLSSGCRNQQLKRSPHTDGYATWEITSPRGPRAWVVTYFQWSCGVTVITPDSESGNPSSNLGRTFFPARANTLDRNERFVEHDVGV